MNPAAELVNKGFIMSRPNAGAHPSSGGRTLIVTGLHRSGTTLVTAILRQVGIFMGAEINDIVHEDEAIAKILLARDMPALTSLIAERDVNYGTWGFKFPMLSQSLRPDEIVLFRDPHLIVPFRDPVTIAVRTALSEYQDPMAALRTATLEQSVMVAFLDQLRCPTLLVSYEKSLIFPGDFIDAILTFCDLPRSDALRESLATLIEPNRPAYITQARRLYEGMVDGVANGCLYGWCRLSGLADPVALQLLADDQPIATMRADGFRQDLLDAGVGSGHHAFSIDLSKFQLPADTVLQVKVAGHGVALENSGRRLWEYGG